MLPVCGRHGRCGDCGYNLAHLSMLRCSECGTEFEPEDVGMAADDRPIDDESPAPAEPAETGRLIQPITCAQCDGALPSEGDMGTCPNCGAAFDRRERIFETYGPEAFIEEPAVEKPTGTASWAPYRRALVFSAVALLSIPVAQYFVRTGAIGADRMPFVIFLFIIAGFEWFRVSRDEDPSEPDDEAEDIDSAGR